MWATPEATASCSQSGTLQTRLFGNNNCQHERGAPSLLLKFLEVLFVIPIVGIVAHCGTCEPLGNLISGVPA